MAGTMMVSKKLLDRLRVAFRKYGAEVLGDPEITIHFFPTEIEPYLWVLLGSPGFKNMGFSERQNSIWEYLHASPDVSYDELTYVTRVATEEEAIEVI